MAADGLELADDVEAAISKVKSIKRSSWKWATFSMDTKERIVKVAATAGGSSDDQLKKIQLPANDARFCLVDHKIRGARNAKSHLFLWLPETCSNTAIRATYTSNLNKFVDHVGLSNQVKTFTKPADFNDWADMKILDVDEEVD